MKAAFNRSFGCTIVIPLLLLTSCQNEVETEKAASNVSVSETSTVVAATDNMNIDDDAILDNDKIDVAEENRTASAADTTDF